MKTPIPPPPQQQQEKKVHLDLENNKSSFVWWNFYQLGAWEITVKLT